jgi:uncharacterized membrane protein YfcA
LSMDWSQLLPLALLGFAVGFLGTLIGAGGGFILVPVLLLLYPDMKPEAITSISLGVVFLNAASGSWAYVKMKRVDIKSALIFALATLPGAIIGALLTSFISRSIFNVILGCLLILVSVFLLINPHYRTETQVHKRKWTHRSIVDNKGDHFDYSFNIRTGIIISFFVGFLSSLLGIGGGIIHVPALTMLLNFPVHVATATSHFILAVMALAGTIVHIAQGNLDHSWGMMLSIGFGVVLGAQLGAYVSNRVNQKVIIISLATALLLVGVRIAFF